MWVFVGSEETKVSSVQNVSEFKKIMGVDTVQPHVETVPSGSAATGKRSGIIIKQHHTEAEKGSKTSILGYNHVTLHTLVCQLM